MKEALLSAVLACLSTAAATESSGQTAPSIVAPHQERLIVLDFRPFVSTPTFGVLSRSIVVGRDRMALVTRYSPNRLVVEAVLSGRLSTEAWEGLRRLSADPVLVGALQQKSFVGTGVEEGDVFRLALAFPEGPSGECYGLMQLAPEAMQLLIVHLLNLGAELQPGEVASHYVRSEAVSPERLAAIGESLPVRELGELPSELVQVVLSAIQGEGAFRAIEPEQYEALLGFASHGNEVLIRVNNRGSQLGLFTSSNGDKKGR